MFTDAAALAIALAAIRIGKSLLRRWSEPCERARTRCDTRRVVQHHLGCRAASWSTPTW